MNEKSSKWKVFVVAFVLVFAGFTAIMMTPTVLAQDPTVTTEPAEDIATHTATLNMSFDMDGLEDVTVWFQYNETGEDLDIEVGEEEYGPGNDTHSFALDDLEPFTDYSYIGVLQYYDEDTEENVTVEGDPVEFTTAPDVAIDGPDWVHVNVEEATYYADVEEDQVASYSWTIMEGEDVVATGDGDNITHTFGHIHNTVMLEIEDVNGVNVTAEMGVTAYYHFELTVTDSETEDPIEGVDVVIEYPVDVRLEETTDENGVVTFEELTTDHFTLSADHYEYTTVYGIEYENITADDAPEGVFEDTLELDPREDFIVEIGPILRVNEFTGEEFPIDDATVNLTSVETGDYWVLEADDDGMAIFTVPENPLNRSFEISITHDLFEYHSTLVEDYIYGRIEFTQHLHIGPVVDAETDEPIPDVDLRIQLIDEIWDESTGGDGTYRLTLDRFVLLEDLSFGVRFEKYEYHDIATTYEGSMTGRVELEPREEFAILVGPIVERFEGEYQPLDGVEVTLDHDDMEPMTDYTDYEGEVSFYVDFDPREEVFSLEASLEGYRTVSQTFSGTESGRIVMSEIPPEIYEVEVGSVRDQEGRVVEGALVRLMDADGTYIESGETDEFGFIVFETEIDPEGYTFNYEIEKAGFEDADGQFTGPSSGDITIQRIIIEPDEYTLTVNIDGEGSVNINPDQETYEEGTEVTLTPSADDGWRFRRWTGDVSTTRRTITITMDEDITVTAEFEEEPEDPDDEISTAMLAGIGLIVIIIIIIIAVMMMKKGTEEPMEEEFEEEDELFEEEEFEEEEDLFGEEEDLFEEEEELFEEEEEFGEEEELFEEEEEEFGEEEFEEEEFGEEEEFEEEDLFEEEEE